MKFFFCLFYLLLPSMMFPQTGNVKLEKATPFLPNPSFEQDIAVDWYYLKVPETWEKPGRKKIKLAVAVLKNKKNSLDKSPLLFIAGGPGAGSIEQLQYWLGHPLLKEKDIVLVDLRGTGYSLPRLCPELGQAFMGIMAKNQSGADDIKEKVKAVEACQRKLIEEDIDLSAYNSLAISNDLHALQKALGYSKWSVYSTSYGTYTAQLYASRYAGDLDKLIMDSPISDIKDNYYNSSTTNFIKSLTLVFDQCKSNPLYKGTYGDLQDKFYATVEKLQHHPLTVKVDPSVVAGGEFTFNPEDFKLCIQQCLNRKEFIATIPLLITQFYEGNKDALTTLVPFYLQNLGLDYGFFYCVTCAEAFPYNSLDKFEGDAMRYPQLSGAISFYKADYLACGKWRQNLGLATVPELPTIVLPDIPQLIISGGYDALTPISNGERLFKQSKKASLIIMQGYGHLPSFTEKGSEYITAFLQKPHSSPDHRIIQVPGTSEFLSGITLNAGILNFANSLNVTDPVFFAPLLCAVAILFFYTLYVLFLCFARKSEKKGDRGLAIGIAILSILGLLTLFGFISAIYTTAIVNFQILLFGLPERYQPLFVLLWIFGAATALSLCYFIIRWNKTKNTVITFTVLFSLCTVSIYFLYWGVY